MCGPGSPRPAPAAPGLRGRDARLSCRFCVLASRSALVLAARLDPDGAERRAQMEERMGHTFRYGLSMRDIITEAKTITGPVVVEDWAA